MAMNIINVWTFDAESHPISFCIERERTANARTSDLIFSICIPIANGKCGIGVNVCAFASRMVSRPAGRGGRGGREGRHSCTVCIAQCGPRAQQHVGIIFDLDSIRIYQSRAIPNSLFRVFVMHKHVHKDECTHGWCLVMHFRLHISLIDWADGHESSFKASMYLVRSEIRIVMKFTEVI